jgi:predicted membrane-bound mannosyltransferase
MHCICDANNFKMLRKPTSADDMRELQLPHSISYACRFVFMFFAVCRSENGKIFSPPAGRMFPVVVRAILYGAGEGPWPSWNREVLMSRWVRFFAGDLELLIRSAYNVLAAAS